MRFWAVALKGTKSCRTQGDFCLSVCSFVRLLVPPGPLRPAICPLRPEIFPLRPEVCLLRPSFCPLRPGGTNRRTDGMTNESPPVFYRTSSPSGPLPKNQGLRGQILGLRGQISGLRGPGGGTDVRMNGRTDEQKSPCILQDFVPFGAAALLPLTPFHNHAKQGNGYH